MLLELRFAADPAQLCDMRRSARTAMATLGCGARWVAEVVLAINEACTNVIQHAYAGDVTGEIVLQIGRTDSELEVRVLDFAPPVVVPNIRARRLAEVRPGGLGTHFIKTVMDRWEYGNLPDGTGNFLHMRKRIVASREWVASAPPPARGVEKCPPRSS